MSTITQNHISETRDVMEENDLPEGWTAASLSSISSKITDGTHKTPEYIDKGVRFVSTANVVPFRQGFDFSQYKRFIPDAEHRELTKRCLPEEGDVLISKCGTIGRSKEVDVNYSFSIFVGLALLKPLRGLFARGFLECFLNSPEIQSQFEDFAPGSTRRTLTLSGINRVELRIPPLAEQERIAAKVEELLAQVNAACARLAKVTQTIKRFRQAVLAAASSGRLTEDWRKNNPISDNITGIVETIYRRRQSESHSQGQKEKLRQIYQSSEENDSSQLPEEWGFTALNKLCASFDYGTSAKSKPCGLVPVLRMGNIQDSKIDWSNLVYTSDRQEIRKYSLAPNTVLFNRTNSPELVGKTALYEGERPAIFAGYLIRIVTQPELDPRYLNLCLNTNYAREFCSQVKTDGVSQSNINAQKLGMFEVPFCPLAEQHEIVRRVEALFKLADSIEKSVEKATKRADKLTQAILAKAFRGELVPTEAELARREGRYYESATELLARIKTKREEAQPPQRPARKPPRPRKGKA